MPGLWPVLAVKCVKATMSGKQLGATIAQVPFAYEVSAIAKATEHFREKGDCWGKATGIGMQKHTILLPIWFTSKWPMTGLGARPEGVKPT